MTCQTGLRFRVGDARCGLLGHYGVEKFSGIVLREVVEHLPDEHVDLAMGDAHSLLSVGGIVVVSVPSRNIRIPGKHYRHYEEGSLRETLMRNNFGVIELSGFGFWPIDFRWLKSKLNSVPKLWQVVNLLWREAKPSRCQTLVAVGRKERA